MSNHNSSLLPPPAHMDVGTSKEAMNNSGPEDNSYSDLSMRDIHDQPHYVSDVATAAAAAAAAQYDAFADAASTPMHDHSMSDKGANGKIKRARSTQRITRNRKITSCLQCRERKQKCDRLRPVCGNCNVGNSRGGMCTYVDTVEAVQEVLANEGEKDAKRTRQTSSVEDKDVQANTSSEAGPSRMAARVPHVSASLAARRMSLIAATFKAGRDKALDFEIRVRCARAAAVGGVLFGTPQSAASDGSPQLYSPPAAVNTLKLPTASEVGPLLDTYRSNVEWMCNVVVVDLNRARIANFLNWYHSNPQTLPADPPLIPLVLVILALAIQARRTIRKTPTGHDQQRKAKRTEAEIKIEEGLDHDLRPGGMPRSRAQTPQDEYVATCSSEKELLETAGRCIDALQIACPSNWASAYSAPLDLVRANLLRGLWHLSELHLQFAGSCFAVSVRLAHAAALNRDTRHWLSMGKEEAQARRNMFWNVATLEVLHTNRVVQPPNILPGGYDAHFPHDHDALLGLYRRAGLIEPYIVEGRRSNFRVQPVSKANFDFHLARFQLTDVLIKGTQPGSSNKNNSQLAEGYENWKKSLPKSLGGVLDKNELGVLGGEFQRKEVRTNAEEDAEAQTRYLQDALLRMMSLSTSIQIHRPQVDETGRWRPPEGQAQRSLELCIDSAQRQIWLVWSILTRDPGPPFVLYSFCIFYCFQAAIIIAIQSALCGTSQNSNDPSAFAVLARPSLDKAVRALDLVASSNGLRLVAEQASRYSSTLREIDLAQQRSKAGDGRGVGKGGNAIDTVPSAAIGAPPPIIVEGNGRKLGGQGYPSRHASRSTSPDTATMGQSMQQQQQQQQQQHQQSHVPANNGIMPANQFEDISAHSFGFDFSDLQVFPMQQHQQQQQQQGDGSMSHSQQQQQQQQQHQQQYYPLASFYADRPLHDLYEPSSNTPISYTRDGSSHQASTGLDLLAAQVEQARHQTQSQWTSNASPQQQQQQGHHANNRQPGLGNVPGAGEWPPTSSMGPSQPQGGHAYPPNMPQGWSKDGAISTTALPASAPAVESMGETFATDWDEWERAVNRLLHSEI